jgi:hypothetical protein
LIYQAASQNGGSVIGFDIDDVRIHRNSIGTRVMEMETKAQVFPESLRWRIEAQARAIRQSLNEIDGVVKDAYAVLRGEKVEVIGMDVAQPGADRTVHYVHVDGEKK